MEIRSFRNQRPKTQGSLFEQRRNEIRKDLDQNSQNFVVNVNLSSINTRNYMKDKIKQKYMEHFRDKLNLRNKSRILPPSEDYLHKLTTKELDDLINMEKNRYLESQLEIKAEQKEQEPYQKKHNRIYRPVFLTHLNKVVKKNNFLNRDDNLISSHYRTVRKNTTKSKYEDEISNSYPQHENLDNFSVQGKRITNSRQLSCRSRKNVWFSGMSKSLISKTYKYEQPVFRGMNIERKSERASHSRFRTTLY